MIKLTNVEFCYGNEHIIDECNFTVNNGDLIGIIGENGIGKTTLLKIILGIYKVHSGEVINDFKNIGFLSQINIDNKISNPCNVREIVSLGLKKKPFQFIKKEEWEKVDNALKSFGLYDLRNRRLDELSGGQKQKVRLLEAVISEPDLLVLDEPTSGIDKESKIEIRDLLSKYHKDNKTIIIVSHNKEDFPSGTKIVDVKDISSMEEHHA